MWPMLLDLSRDESKRVLRRMELEAYSSVITAFRAQGDLTKEKKAMLQDLQNVLSISTERHRAEVRRAVNDEKLATVADNIAGSNTTSEWMIEGRRLVPLMPRLVPQTAFTATANQAAHLQAEKNLTLPLPVFTGNKEVNNVTSVSTSTSTSTPPTSRPSCPTSPTSNVVVLPSGASIHIKGCLNTDYEEEMHTRKRRRSLSNDSLSSSIGTQTPRLTYPTTTTSSVPSMSPVKITISKSPQGRTIVSTPGVQPPKVILVTTSGQTVGHNVFQKSVSVPVVRATASTSQGTARTPVMVPSSSPVSSGNFNNVYAVTTTSLTSSITTPVTTSVLGSPPPMVINSGLPKPRPKIIPRQRLPQPIPSQKPGVVIPMTPQPVQPSPQSYQIKTVNKPTIQIKQEGGMKIITQSLPPGTSKILPKPAHLSSNSGTPVVVVNAGPSGTATTTVSMVTKPVTTLSGNHPAGKVLNISTAGGRVIATTTKSSNVVTVNPKTLHLTAVKTGAGTTVSKPNVIVVQKTQTRRASTPTHPAPGSSQECLTVKELANIIQKQEKNISVTSGSALSNLGSALSKIGDRKVIITTQTVGEAAKHTSGPILQRSRPEQEGKTSSLLAELIQAAGIVPEAAAETDVPGTGSGNEWFEYDVTDDQGHTVVTTTEDSTAIDALLQRQAADAAGKVKESSLASAQLERLQGQQPETQYYTIDQAMSLLNQTEKDNSSTDTSQSSSDNTAVKSEQAQIHIIKTSLPGSKLPAEHIQHIRVPLPSSRQPGLGSRALEITRGQSSSVRELDPQTGLFSSSGVRKQRKNTVIVGLSPKVVTPPVGTAKSLTTATTQSQNFDLLSSSLAQAQIDLDSFEYVQSKDAVTVGDSAENSNVKETRDISADKIAPSIGDTIIPVDDSVTPIGDTVTAAGDNVTAVGNEVVTVGDSMLRVGDTVAPSVGNSVTIALADNVGDIHSVGDKVMHADSVPPTENVTVKLAGDSVVTETVGDVADSEGVVITESTEEIVTQSSGDTVTQSSGDTVTQSQGEIVGDSVTIIGTADTLTETGESVTLSSDVIHSKDVTSPEDTSTVSTDDLQKEDSSEKPHEDKSYDVGLSSSTSNISDDTDIQSSATSTTSVPLTDNSSTVQKSAINIIIHAQTHVQTDLLDTSEENNSSSENIMVTMDPTVELVPLTREELTSQQTGEKHVGRSSEEKIFLDKTEVVLSESGSPTGSSCEVQEERTLGDSGREASNALRLSSRKRKQGTLAEEPQHISTMGGWVRASLGLIQRVSKFRGANREKGDLNAAAWFLKPVDPVDAPNYYSVVKNPMDFGTIKKKIETGDYKSFDDFHADMILVQSNCNLYNHPDSKVRQDCEEVFAFYQQERAKVLDKLQKGMNFSPVVKKFRIDKSPAKS